MSTPSSTPSGARGSSDWAAATGTSPSSGSAASRNSIHSNRSTGSPGSTQSNDRSGSNAASARAPREDGRAPTTPGEPADGARVPWRGALVVFLVALAVRVLALVALDASATATKGPWEFGYEASSIADAVREGRGFATPWRRAEAPWNEDSGATGWLVPGYPALLAGLFELFGGLVPAAAFALFLLQCLASAATSVLLWHVGAALGHARTGRLAAWAFAFLPGAVWIASGLVWDTSFVACGIVLVALVAVRAARARPLAWCGVGALFGALLLVNPAPLALVPCFALLAHARRDTTARWLARLGAAGVVAFLVCLPWLARNQRELGAFALRTNLGVELHVGNFENAHGRFEIGRHPAYDRAEFRRYRELGEVAYAAAVGREAWQWAAEHPGEFVRLSVYRVYLFWIGADPFHDSRTTVDGEGAERDPKSWIKFLAFALVGVAGLAGAIAWSRREAVGRAWLAAFVLFPAAYYVTHVSERYRFPIEPLLVLCAAWLVVHRRAGRGSPASPGS